MFEGNEKNPLAKFVIMNSYSGEFKPSVWLSFVYAEMGICNNHWHKKLAYTCINVQMYLYSLTHMGLYPIYILF